MNMEVAVEPGRMPAPVHERTTKSENSLSRRRAMYIGSGEVTGTD